MRSLHLVLAVTLSLGSNASAQDWYQFPADAIGVAKATISYTAPTETEPRTAWVRFEFSQPQTTRNREPAIEYREMRMRIVANCEQKLQGIPEVELRDEVGNLLLSEASGAAPVALEFSLGGAAVQDVLCEGGEPPDAPINVTLVDTQKLHEAFRSDDVALRQAAASTVQAHPNAFPPLLFVELANELARAGDRAGAVKWYQFGAVRYMIDSRASYPTDESMAEIGHVLPLYQHLPSVELADILNSAPLAWDDAFAWDQEVPRDYPVDWWRWPQMGYLVAWGDPATPRPGTDWAARTRLDEARVWARESLTAAPDE